MFIGVFAYGKGESGAVARQNGVVEFHVGDSFGAQSVISCDKLRQKLDERDFTHARNNGMVGEMAFKAKEILVEGDGDLIGVVWKLGYRAEALQKSILYR